LVYNTQKRQKSHICTFTNQRTKYCYVYCYSSHKYKIQHCRLVVVVSHMWRHLAIWQSLIVHLRSGDSRVQHVLLLVLYYKLCSRPLMEVKWKYSETISLPMIWLNNEQDVKNIGWLRENSSGISIPGYQLNNLRSYWLLSVYLVVKYICSYNDLTLIKLPSHNLIILCNRFYQICCVFCLMYIQNDIIHVRTQFYCQTWWAVCIVELWYNDLDLSIIININ